jgi:hypothetical protein
MITKAEATYNISKAYLDYCVANRLYWDTLSCLETERDYHIKTATYRTMRECYLACGILTYDEIDSATDKKYKLEKIQPVE